MCVYTEMLYAGVCACMHATQDHHVREPEAINYLSNLPSTVSAYDRISSTGEKPTVPD